MLNKLAIPVALITLVVIGFVRASPQNSEQVNAYHEHVAALIDAIPIDWEGWVGHQVALPQAATNLLRPNALVARQYVHEQRGVSATLMIVQCRDARDMAGHYPPACYPGNGWLIPEDEGTPLVDVEGDQMQRYPFHRVAGKNEREITVYNMFAMPTGFTTVSMVDVRRLSSDYEYRMYGAAQIQIVIDGDVDPSLHEWILQELHALVAPAIEGVQDSGIDAGKHDGSGS
ncbi:MAG: exosortase-associated EpsI family protein [Phycisphaerales bacterium JB047]